MGDAQRAPFTQGGMTLIWSPEAIDDLASLRTYISVDDPAAAKRVALHIIHSVEELLSQNPQLGHPGRVPGTREIVIPQNDGNRVSTAHQTQPDFRL
jgi:plasmid stabilization system protein ParE